MLQKRAKGISQPGEISFPGGHYEKDIDANFLQTAIRETCEEIGTKKSNIRVFGQLETLASLKGDILFPFLAELKTADNLKPNKKETEKIILAPISHFRLNSPEKYSVISEIKSFEVIDREKVDTFPAKKIGLPRKYHTSWSKTSHPIYLFRYKKSIIWGMTARLIMNFLEKTKSISF